MVASACLPIDRRGSHGSDADVSDEELIRRSCAGDDAAAFESLVHRYERGLFGYLRRYLGSAEMAEDVFQLTFLQVHLKREGFEPGRRFRPWLYAIATHQAIDAQRRDRRHRRMVSLEEPLGHASDAGTLRQLIAARGGSGPETRDDQAVTEWLRTAVDTLPAAQKAVLTLVYHGGLRYREVATALGVPVGTVKSRLHAAIRRLTRSWQGKALR
ncbi:MAG: sigma-70 family RNA polymerase sigma factor [Planctomycetia bacterium]|nr:sigma-70 family RNA polymerase sigma factor [Planctomycetia bacterium]